MTDKPLTLLFHALQGLEARLSDGSLDMSGGDWALVVALREAARGLRPASHADERGIAQRERMRALYLIDARAEALVAECVKYLKPGETPAGRIRREIADTSRMIGVVGKWKRRAIRAEAIVNELRAWTARHPDEPRAHVDTWMAVQMAGWEPPANDG